MTDTEYSQALQFMKKNLVKEQGLVGIFWYDVRDKKLFGVHKESPFNHEINCGGGLVSCVGDYKDIPRGRIFFKPDEKKFFVCVGSWISEHTEVIDLVVEEFCLENENYEFVIREHWELGMGYGD